MIDTGHKVVFGLMAIALQLGLFAATAVGQGGESVSKFEGRVEALHSAAVAPSIDGRIVRIAFQKGQFVKSGDLLVELDDYVFSGELQVAKGNLARARAQLRGKQHSFNVEKDLRKKGVATEVSYIDALAKLDMAQAEVVTAEGKFGLAQYRLARTKITAPISGQIDDVNVLVGSFVEAETGKPLATIVQLDPISVAFKVPYERQIAALAADKTLEDVLKDATATILLNGRPYEHIGKLQFSAPVIDPSDGTVTLRALFSNSRRLLRPGLKVSVKLQFAGN